MNTNRPEIEIDEAVFQFKYDAFVEYVEQQSGRSFLSFSSNPRTKVEDYKFELHRKANEKLKYDQWNSDHIGLGKIATDVKNSIEIKSNNIFEWDARRGEENRVHQPIYQALQSREAAKIEEVFYKLYRSDDSATSFNQLIEVFGSRNGLISYLMFIKDRSSYMPIAPTYFDNAFASLAIDLKTSNNCNWETYTRFNSVLKAIQQRLQMRIESEVTLLDAHSFAWIIGYDKAKDFNIPEFDENDRPKATERLSLVSSRIGQPQFRNSLIEYWGSCAVTACTETRVLRASHIKPWSKSNDEERLDPFNGLLLTAGLDACFDDGLISFTDDGEILISNALDEANRRALGLKSDMKLRQINSNHTKYLKYHREHIFNKNMPSNLRCVA